MFKLCSWGEKMAPSRETHILHRILKGKHVKIFLFCNFPGGWGLAPLNPPLDQRMIKGLYAYAISTIIKRWVRFYLYRCAKLWISHFMLLDGPEGGYDENCMVHVYTTITWDDEDCHNLLPSICECKLNDCKYSWAPYYTQLQKKPDRL